MLDFPRIARIHDGSTIPPIAPRRDISHARGATAAAAEALFALRHTRLRAASWRAAIACEFPRSRFPHAHTHTRTAPAHETHACARANEHIGAAAQHRSAGAEPSVQPATAVQFADRRHPGRVNYTEYAHDSYTRAPLAFARVHALIAPETLETFGSAHDYRAQRSRAAACV